MRAPGTSVPVWRATDVPGRRKVAQLPRPVWLLMRKAVRFCVEADGIFGPDVDDEDEVVVSPFFKKPTGRTERGALRTPASNYAFAGDFFDRRVRHESNWIRTKGVDHRAALRAARRTVARCRCGRACLV